MANITGTNGNDTLIGTAEDDTIQGLNGNDIIFSSSGNDTIDGGAGNDTVDYTNSSSVVDGTRVEIISNKTLESGVFVFDGLSALSSKLINIETIVGSNALLGNGAGLNTDGSADIDLSKHRITYSSSSFFGTKTLTLKNFNSINASVSGNIRVKGSDIDDNIAITSNDSRTGDRRIIGSKGNDILNGGGVGTVDYSNIDRAISLNVTDLGSRFGISVFLGIDKNGFGVDKISSFKKIIGINNKENTISASAVGLSTKLDVNLKNNSLTITVPPGDNQFINPGRIDKYEVINFVNVTGGRNDDKIVGGDKNSKLIGGGGNDTITGGNRNDRITGSDRTARGVGEVDTLTGGGGRDKFILGDKGGAYYVGTGNNDYALITDFDLFKDSISIGSLKDYSFAIEAINTINLYSGKDVNTRDLIAKIQITGGISSIASNSRSVMGSESNLNALIGKIDILSGSESVGESLPEMRES
jgi:Ca2+-binding RTX toxin-like protein